MLNRQLHPWQPGRRPSFATTASQCVLQRHRTLALVHRRIELNHATLDEPHTAASTTGQFLFTQSSGSLIRRQSPSYERAFHTSKSRGLPSTASESLSPPTQPVASINDGNPSTNSQEDISRALEAQADAGSPSNVARNTRGRKHRRTTQSLKIRRPRSSTNGPQSSPSQAKKARGPRIIRHFVTTDDRPQKSKTTIRKTGILIHRRAKFDSKARGSELGSRKVASAPKHHVLDTIPQGAGVVKWCLTKAAIEENNLLSGTIIVSSGSKTICDDLLSAIKPLDCMLPKGRASLLLLFTPSFAQDLRKDPSAPEFLVTRIVNRFLDRLRISVSHLRPRVGLAVVNSLPSMTGHSAKPNDVATEGMSFVFASSLAKTELNEPSETKHVTMSFAALENVKSEEHREVNRVKVEIPLANTVFHTGHEDCLMTFTYRHSKANRGDRCPREFVLKSCQDSLSNIKASVRLKQPETDRTIRISTPLTPLTELRQVEAAMGNIIRQLRRDNAVISASAELENVVNQMVASSSLPASPVAVWALIITPKAHTKLASEGLSLPHPRSPVSAALPSNDDALQQRDLDQSDLSREHDDMLSQYPDLTAILQAGGRLHRVMSGGGGWGKKAGLLSISPAVGFGGASTTPSSASDPDQSYNVSFPWSSESSSSELALALGSPVEPGDFIQFFLATPDVALLNPQREQINTDVHRLFNFGTVPSSVDRMPVLKTGSTTDGKVRFLPGVFGALSEKGVAFSMQRTDAAMKNKVLARSMLDVPYSSVTISQDMRDEELHPTLADASDQPSTAEGETVAAIGDQALATVSGNVDTKSSEQSPLTSADVNEELFATELQDLKAVGDEDLATETENVDPKSSAARRTKYTKYLETLSNDALARETQAIDKAFEEARLARKLATAAIDRMKMPRRTVDEDIEAQGSKHARSADHEPSLRKFIRLAEMNFNDLSNMFLRYRTRLAELGLTDNVAIEKFWLDYGFPMPLVRMLQRYHELKPALPENVLAAFGKPQHAVMVMPFGALRSRAARLPLSQQRHFWEKWRLIRAMKASTIKCARDAFRTELIKRADLEIAISKDTDEFSAVERANKEKIQIWKTLLHHFRRCISKGFDHKRKYWEDRGITVDVRSAMWEKPSTARVIQTLITAAARDFYTVGDAVGAQILAELAWKGNNCQLRPEHVQKERSALRVKFDAGDAHIPTEQVSLRNRPELAAGQTLLSEDSWRSLSVCAPWEYLYRMFGCGSQDQSSSTLIEENERTPENSWGIISGVEDELGAKLGPVFRKMDQDIAAHRASGAEGPATVDIGKEIRDNFPLALRNSEVLKQDIAPAAPEITKVKPNNGPSIRTYKSGVKKIRYHHWPPAGNMAKHVKLDEEFVSEWAVNPNKFAFDIMAKRMRKQIQEKFRQRREEEARPAKQAEDEYDEGVDYDVLERQRERRWDRRGMRQATTRRLRINDGGVGVWQAGSKRIATDRPWDADLGRDEWDQDEIVPEEDAKQTTWMPWDAEAASHLVATDEDTVVHRYTEDHPSWTRYEDANREPASPAGRPATARFVAGDRKQREPSQSEPPAASNQYQWRDSPLRSVDTDPKRSRRNAKPGALEEPFELTPEEQAIVGEKKVLKGKINSILGRW